MKHPNFNVLAVYGKRESANQFCFNNGLNTEEAVFPCPHGEYGYEVRVYDDWQQWQPNLYIKNI
jgi:hypothetical protein